MGVSSGTRARQAKRQKPVLLLTRPEQDAWDFAVDVEREFRDAFEIVISPLISILPGDVPNLDPFETVVLTSRNAARVAGEALAGRRIATVGARTAEVARDLGADALMLGETVSDFLEQLSDVTPPAIHLRGEHARGDLARTATGRGTAMQEAVIYRQEARDLALAAKERLVTRQVVVPLFSPRSAELLQRAVGEMPVSLHVAAMSQAVADAAPDAVRTCIAEAPTRRGMLDAIAAILDALNLAEF